MVLCLVGTLSTPDHVADLHPACIRRCCAARTGFRHLTAPVFPLNHEFCLSTRRSFVLGRLFIASSGLLLHAWLQCTR